MTHQTTNVSEVQRGAERFGESVRRVDDTRDVTKNDVAVGFPFLNREVLNINVSRAWSWSARVDHQNRSLVVLIQDRRPGLFVIQLMEDGPQVLGNLGGLDGRDKLGFG